MFYTTSTFFLLDKFKIRNKLIYIVIILKQFCLKVSQMTERMPVIDVEEVVEHAARMVTVQRTGEHVA